MSRVVKFYTAENGKKPVKIFIDGLSGKVAQKIAWVLSLVEDMEKIPATYFKKLKDSDDIWECRIKLGSNIYRIFCFFDGNTKVVLTHGLIKKTQKTPKQEIVKAENYKKDYFMKKKHS